MTELLRTGALVLVVVVTACSPASESDAGPDGGEQCHPNLPEPSDPCLEGQCGNALGVGQPCTAGGGECSDWGFTEAFLCTADFSDTNLWFCTKACVDDSDCGAGASCAIDTNDPGAGAGCVLDSCAGDDEPDEDAGFASDAGVTGDAG